MFYTVLLCLILEYVLSVLNSSWVITKDCLGYRGSPISLRHSQNFINIMQLKCTKVKHFEKQLYDHLWSCLTYSFNIESTIFVNIFIVLCILEISGLANALQSVNSLKYFLGS